MHRSDLETGSGDTELAVTTDQRARQQVPLCRLFLCLTCSSLGGRMKGGDGRYLSTLESDSGRVLSDYIVKLSVVLTGGYS